MMRRSGRDLQRSCSEGQLSNGTVERASGDYWMHHGMGVSLRGDFQAAFLTLQRETQ
jgi:alpha-galactosidase